MLNDDEFKHALTLRGTGEDDLRERQFGPVLAKYERVTGQRETNIDAFYHHLIRSTDRRVVDAANRCAPLKPLCVAPV